MPFSDDQNNIISIRKQDAEKLIRSGNGRACLYYLCSHTSGQTSVPVLARLLGWSQEEAFAARTALEVLGLCTPLSEQPPVNEQLPSYTPQEINSVIDGDPAFKSLIDYTKLRLNKLLTPTDMRTLLGLYHYLGMPAGVLMLLISYTVEHIRKRRGEAARVGMSQIESEGYYWHRLGIMTEPAAEEYIRRKTEEDHNILSLARLLNIKDRSPTPTEEKYLAKWAGFGMDNEVIYTAYDKTVVNTGALKWGYMNTILEDWHTKGVRSVQDLSEKPRTSPSGSPPRGQQPTDASAENAAERLKRMRTTRQGNEQGR